MRARLCGLGLFAVLSLVSGGANAQDNPAEKPQDGAIVVTGQRDVPREAAQKYVQQISSSVDGQLIQFREPVCPVVLGYGEQYNAIVQRRIRTIAAEAGVPLAGEKCEANLVLIIANDADALVKSLRKELPRLFDGVDKDALKRAFQEGPVHVWNATQLRSRDGKTVVHVPGKEGSKFENALQVQSASIIEQTTLRAIVGAVVVIDGDATMGKTLNQIADYTAMRALAGARPPRQSVEPTTILTLFEPAGTAPREATSFDRSYLSGLYHSRPTARSTTAMGSISAQIVRNAKEDDGKEKN